MAINVLQAAKHLCKESGWELTNLEIQKILYITNMFYLGKFRAPRKIGQSPPVSCRLTMRKSVLEQVSYGPASFARAGGRQFFEVPFNRSLLNGYFEAWKYGPVNPLVYNHLKCFVSSSVDERAFDNISYLDESKYEKEIKLLKEAAIKFPHPSGSRLISITHDKEVGAWNKIYTRRKRDLIPEKEILNEYQRRIDRQKEKKNRKREIRETLENPLYRSPDLLESLAVTEESEFYMDPHWEFPAFSIAP